MDLRPWNEECSYEETISILGALAHRVAERITNRDAKTALQKAVHDHDWRAISDWVVDYSGGVSASDLISIRQVLGFFQKLEPLSLGVDKKSVALAKFLESEVKCRETNVLFKHWSSGDLVFSRNVESILFMARRKIARVLGDVPKFSALDFKFGPGATCTVPKRNACSRIKLSTVPSCTANVLPNLPMFWRENPLWSALHTKRVYVDDDGWVVQSVSVEVTHGKLSFVPKNAKTYRSVMTEPTINAVLQAGYGEVIARRLLSVGQNIRDQSRNQRLARVGSITNGLATIDLSSASDSIATELVAHLLPYDWYAALSECRTPTYIDDSGSIKTLAKFSSMGNGFTFPLQTLIFWALVSSCTDKLSPGGVVSVYGDDIIIPSTVLPLVEEVFAAVGFTLNRDKSYSDGPFRESCGADYFLGTDIRPYYQKRLLSFQSLFIMHNFFYRNHDNEMCELILEFIPKEIRIFGPDGYGDGHLLGAWNPKRHRRSEGWCGYLFDTYVAIGRKHSRPMIGDRVLPAYSIMVSGGGLRILPNQEISYASLPVPKYGKQGVPAVTLPGVRGYKRISVYTFSL